MEMCVHGKATKQKRLHAYFYLSLSLGKHEMSRRADDTYDNLLRPIDHSVQHPSSGLDACEVAKPQTGLVWRCSYFFLS